MCNNIAITDIQTTHVLLFCYFVVVDNDQIRRKQLKIEGRPQSAHSVSQRSSRASFYSPQVKDMVDDVMFDDVDSSIQALFFQSRYSVQSEDRPYLSSRSSTICSSTFGTSFRANDIVYAHHKAGSQNLIHHVLGASDIKYQRPGPYKASQNPDQKTYGGDLLKKHSQHFTQDKPFTPKTLKSDKSSYLSKYRYYRAPLKKQCQAKLMQQEKDSGRYGQNTSHAAHIYDI